MVVSEAKLTSNLSKTTLRSHINKYDPAVIELLTSGIKHPRIVKEILLLRFQEGQKVLRRRWSFLRRN